MLSYLQMHLFHISFQTDYAPKMSQDVRSNILAFAKVPFSTKCSKFRAPKKSFFKLEEPLSMMSTMNPDPVAHAFVETFFGNIKRFKSMISNSDKDS